MISFPETSKSLNVVFCCKFFPSSHITFFGIPQPRTASIRRFTERELKHSHNICPPFLSILFPLKLSSLIALCSLTASNTPRVVLAPTLLLEISRLANVEPPFNNFTKAEPQVLPKLLPPMYNLYKKIKLLSNS